MFLEIDITLIVVQKKDIILINPFEFWCPKTSTTCYPDLAVWFVSNCVIFHMVTSVWQRVQALVR